MIWNLAVLSFRSSRRCFPPSTTFFMVWAHAIATGSVMKATIVDNGMSPAIERIPTHAKGKSISKRDLK